MKKRTPPPPQPPCEICHGEGEISSFKGESRFILTREECPACSGTGLESAVQVPDRDSAGEDSKD
jgi:DnaJ-class molecular chaperone